MKKQILLTALTLTLLASAVMTAAAEEVVGTILSEPTRYGADLIYELDTMPGDGINDRNLVVRYEAREVYNILPRFLKEGWKVVYENKELKPFQNFGVNHVIEIISPDDNHIDLTELFSLTIIKYSFGDLYAKLVREGCAR